MNDICIVVKIWTRIKYINCRSQTKKRNTKHENKWQTNRNMNKEPKTEIISHQLNGKNQMDEKCINSVFR